jgi:adenosine deaminase
MENNCRKNLINAIEQMPKVELHVHLAGAISSETIMKLAEKNGIDLGCDEESRGAPSSRYGHLLRFLDSYRIRTRCLQSAEDFEIACVDVLSHLQAQRVRYAEITIAPTPYRLNGVSTDELIAGIEAGAMTVCSNGEIDARFIFDVGRQFGLEHAWETVRNAVKHQSAGVIAVGIGGDEAHFSPEIFVEQFEFAKKEGLHRVAHAGEASGSQSIWGALESLDAERIGHGVAAYGDEPLTEHLHVKKIPLEMCPTSNIKTGAVRSYAEHPLPTFLRRGLLVTLNSDDPAMFGASLTDEYRLCVEEFGLEWEELKTVCLNGVNAAFLADMDKAGLREQFGDAFAGIEAELDVT